MTIIARLRQAAIALAALAALACGPLQPAQASDIGTDILYQVFDWMSGGAASQPGTDIPIEWGLTPDDYLTDSVGTKPGHYWGQVATCLDNYPYKGTYSGGVPWVQWQQRNKQDQTMFLAGAFVREGAWLDSITSECSVVMPDGSWKDPKPLQPYAVGYDDRGYPVTQYQSLLEGIIADTGHWIKGERDCPNFLDPTEPCIKYPDEWQMGGSPYVATCPKNSYVYGFNAVYAEDKMAIARVGIHCINPISGAKYYSGTRMVNNSDGTSNGMTYRLYPTTDWNDGIFCPQGQLAVGFAGYLDTGYPKDNSDDHIRTIALICRPYTFNKPPAFSQLGTDLPGNDFLKIEMTDTSDPKACAAECAKNNTCKAWTYAYHNLRNETDCFLKNAVPLAVDDSCCLSGVKPPMGAMVGEDRPGADYYNKEIYAADPNVCADECTGDKDCQSWTYLKPGVRGKNPICYFKNAVPDLVKDSCCISGVNPFKHVYVPNQTSIASDPEKPSSPFGTVPSDALNKGATVAMIPGLPPAPQPAAGVMFGGTWLTRVQNGTRYTVKLSQNADGTVVGGYEAGSITDGVIVGNELFARWHQGNADGTLRFTIAPDNAAFSGTWTNGDFMPTRANAAGTWDGYNMAIFTGVPGGDDFTGTWTVTQSEGATYEMTLSQSGSAITGNYDPGDRAGAITGHDSVDDMVLPHLVFDPAKHPGDGWVQSGGNGSGWFYLYPDKNHISGIWRMADNTNGAWSAVRKDIVVATNPAPEPVKVPTGACPGPTATVTQTAIVHVGLGEPIPGGVTLAKGSEVSCLACERTWCLIASTDLSADAAGQSPTVSRKVLDFGTTTDVAQDAPAPPAPKVPKAPKVPGDQGPVPMGPVNFAGDWKAMSGRGNCYDWHLDQAGNAVTGTYSPLNATITGHVVANVLHFDWTERDANLQPTASGSGMVSITNVGSFAGRWWSPAAPAEPPGNDPVNVWNATRVAAGQGCAGGGVASGGGKFNLPLSKLGSKLGADTPGTVDSGGSANDNAPPPPPVIR